MDYDETVTTKSLSIEQIVINAARTNFAFKLTNVGAFSGNPQADFTFLRYNIVLIGSEFEGFTGTTDSSFIYGKVG